MRSPRLQQKLDLQEARAEIARLQGLLNTPELFDFTKAVVLEAAHQRIRWGSEHDEGKQPEDWLWLLGWLAGKAVQAARGGDRDKALHHCISSAAVLANWHANLLGDDRSMRPGILAPAEALEGRLAALERDSHPPIDLGPAMLDILRGWGLTPPGERP